MLFRVEKPTNSLQTQKTYHFQKQWEDEFFFIEVKGKVVYLLCESSVPQQNRSNVERHHNSVHKNFEHEFPPKSLLRSEKLTSLKSLLESRQNIFSQQSKMVKNRIEASFRANYILAQHKKSFSDGTIVKEVMLDVAECLFPDFKNKSCITSAPQY